MVMSGAASYRFAVFFAGALAPQATFDDDVDAFDEFESSLFVSWRITNTITSGISSNPKLRMLRLRFLFFSASNWAPRRASRFWRWRSRFSGLGTAAESTDGISGGRFAGALR